ncbi:helix-turn-helix transcriptional regulator [Shouchella clausii]|jgi:transcriptional regulator with XRE-family HTH domain|uniref:Transcriptional regulator n=3 Tax=Shouchella TaxID=2893057 RepID=Q5WH75_SHOC1|nr:MULTISPECIES: helix-turn-helix transcriptional regulator [Shouchella]MCM3312516.1 helix-turn-helix transcriptional regulator [Psychrobacillus sp. MER TA 17]PAD43770.1 XRE family transcriptional regulator [Bacillus sp. 7520-S]SPU21960.1 transcriptional regulator [Niallia circulans]ALA51084.1 hypothetical protein DB29_00256 [Shouchella clausii]AST98028.1 transcriptional regulator [Shouchella clausii]
MSESSIRILRTKKGYSLEEVAKEVGISAGYLSQIESGKRQVSAEIAKLIAKLFSVDREELFEATRFKAIRQEKK